MLFGSSVVLAFENSVVLLLSVVDVLVDVSGCIELDCVVDVGMIERRVAGSVTFVWVSGIVLIEVDSVPLLEFEEWSCVLVGAVDSLVRGVFENKVESVFAVLDGRFFDVDPDTFLVVLLKIAEKNKLYKYGSKNFKQRNENHYGTFFHKKFMKQIMLDC